MNKTENEVWKTYPEFDFIQGSNLGRVRTVDRYVKTKNGKRLIKGRILKQWHNNSGYLYVSSTVNGRVVNRLVHRIIASCFLTNYHNLSEVNHKDCNPGNNNVSNLEWITHKENIAYRDKLGHTARNNGPKKPVCAVNLNAQKASWFKLQTEASRKLGVNLGHLNSVIKGKRKTAGGYWFTNADKNAVEVVRTKFGDPMADKVAELLKDKK